MPEEQGAQLCQVVTITHGKLCVRAMVARILLITLVPLLANVCVVLCFIVSTETIALLVAEPAFVLADPIYLALIVAKGLLCSDMAVQLLIGYFISVCILLLEIRYAGLMVLSATSLGIIAETVLLKITPELFSSYISWDWRISLLTESPLIGFGAGHIIVYGCFLGLSVGILGLLIGIQPTSEILTAPAKGEQKSRTPSKTGLKSIGLMCSTVLSLFLIVFFYCVAWLEPNVPRALSNWIALEKVGFVAPKEDWYRLVQLLRAPMPGIQLRPILRTYAAEAATQRLVQGGQKAIDDVMHYGILNCDAQIRYMSMTVLGRIGDKKHSEAILHVLFQEKDGRVLVCGAEALCMFGRNLEAKPFLERVLADWNHAEPIGGLHVVERWRRLNTAQLAELLNRRYRLGLEVPDQFYRYLKPIDEDKYSLEKK